MMYCLMLLILSLENLFAEDIPRDSLRIELLLETWSSDTSWLWRLVTSTWLAPEFKIDGTSGVSYAQFSGSGWITAVTGWNGSSTDDFTLSLWVKVRPQDLPTLTGMYLPNTYVPIHWYMWPVSTQYLATIFSSHMSQTINAMSIRLRKDFQCAIGGIKQSWTYYLDSINNPAFFIDCSKLNDSKWHLMIVKRYNRVLTFQIDNDIIYSGIQDVQIGRTFALGYFPLSAHTGALAYQMWQSYQLTNIRSFFKGSLTKFRFYSRALTPSEIMSLQDENIILQSEWAGTWNISVWLHSYNNQSLQLTLSGIPLWLSQNRVTYQFMVNSWIYQDILSSSITDISRWTWSHIYRLTLNMSSYPDGLTSIQLRTKSWSLFQNIGVVKFTKIDQQYGITISEPSTMLGLSKNLSAIISGTGILTMHITRWNVCDATLTFEAYSDVVFTSKSDNFTRICYRAQYLGLNKVIYKLSAPVQGITWASNSHTWSKIFDDYLIWTRSSYAKFNDTANTVLDLLSVNAGSANGTINGVTLTDINWDGLVDFIYSRSDPIRRAIIINNWNYTFRVVYKCAVDPSPIVYFWDCADSSR